MPCAAAVSSSGNPVETLEGLGYPRGIRLDVSSGGVTWHSIAQAAGSGRTTTFTFAPLDVARFRLVLTASDDKSPAWSIQNLRVFGPGSIVSPAERQIPARLADVGRAGRMPFVHRFSADFAPRRPEDPMTVGRDFALAPAPGSLQY